MQDDVTCMHLTFRTLSTHKSGACYVQGISCKTFTAFVIQGTVGDNVILG